MEYATNSKPPARETGAEVDPDLGAPDQRIHCLENMDCGGQ